MVTPPPPTMTTVPTTTTTSPPPIARCRLAGASAFELPVQILTEPPPAAWDRPPLRMQMPSLEVQKPGQRWRGQSSARSEELLEVPSERRAQSQATSNRHRRTASLKEPHTRVERKSVPSAEPVGLK
mmetsp:Transcript_126323/g.404402  ORF Transcript_126323/g.404402 Transcript_126323/m.404402 type:complete len:127 (-) Transcript_126323:22-402(-)